MKFEFCERIPVIRNNIFPYGIVEQFPKYFKIGQNRVITVLQAHAQITLVIVQELVINLPEQQIFLCISL